MLEMQALIPRLYGYKLGKGVLRDEARENQQREPDTVLGMKLVYFKAQGSKTFHMQKATGRKNLINRNEPSDESVAKMLA